MRMQPFQSASECTYSQAGVVQFLLFPARHAGDDGCSAVRGRELEAVLHPNALRACLPFAIAGWIGKEHWIA